MVNKQEEEITKNWILTNESLVSICCITYNHEKYIAEALDSFLMQETDFPFEILIHEDASTDNTAKIIRSYENKYPSLIKPIYQTENQYSKGIKINATFNLPRAKGEYIALCEGDDFWTDKGKLQYQIEKMKEYNKCEISFHPTKFIKNQTMSDTIFRRHAKYDKIFDIKEIIRGDGGFCPTASLIIKKEVFDDIPSFFQNTPVGDYFIQIFGSVNGGALYIDKTMSAYRIHSGGVWTSRESNFLSRKKFAFEMLDTLNEMDEFFNFKYYEDIAFIKSHIFSAILNKKKFSIDDRKLLYQQCKEYLLTEHNALWIQELYTFLEEQKILIENQNKTIKDKTDLLQKNQEVISQYNNKVEILMDAIQNVTKFSIIVNPIKKYRAYKEILTTYYTVRRNKNEKK